MSLAFSTRYKSYSPVVSTTDFLVTFPVYDVADLLVKVDGVETAAFSVTATFSGGISTDATVVLDSAVSGVSVEIFGDRQPRRENALTGGAPRFAETIQSDLEAVIATQQELYRGFERIEGLVTDELIALGAYESRAAAEAATVDSEIRTLWLLHNGLLLGYQKASTGTCLTTNGGAQKWKPITTLPAYLQHWGVTTYDSEAAALAGGAAMSGSERTAEQTRIENAFGEDQGELVIHGYVEFYDTIIANPARIIRLSRGVEYDGLCTSSRFNTATAAECFYAGLPAYGSAEIVSLNILHDQTAAAASGNRGDLVGYPVSLRIAGDFAKIGHVRIQRAIDGIAATGAGAVNNGGLYVGKWEIGAFNDALNMDGALHFTDIESIDIWPYGFSGSANLLSIYNDGTAVPATIARLDNLRVGRIGVFQAGPIILDTPVSGALPWQIDTISLDSDWAYLVLGRGQSQIDKMYGTEVIDASHRAYKIRVTEGHHTIVSCDLVGDADTLVKVEAGYIKLGGRLRQNNGDRLAVTVTGGTIDVSECQLVGLGASHNVALVSNSGGTVLAGNKYYTTRAAMVTDLAALALDAVQEGDEIEAGGRTYVKMRSTHALYGTDPIADLPGYAAAGPYWTPEHNGTTGAANDTNVVDAASAAAAGCGMPLLFEGKTYRGGFKLRNDGVWIGVKGQTMLRVHETAGSTQSAAYFNVNTTDGRLTNFHASGIIFDGTNSLPAGGCGVLVWGFDGISFTDCIFQNAGTYGFGAQARPGHAQSDLQDGLNMTRCGFIDNGVDGSWDGLDIKHGTRMQFTDCWSTGNTNCGFNIRGGASINGLRSYSNAGANIRFQATDLSAGYPTRIVGSGIYSGSNTSGTGFHIQASALNDTFVNVSIECTGAAGTSLELSGAGKIYGMVNAIIHNGLSHGVYLTGNYVGQLVLSGLIYNNAGDGVKIAATGQNLHFNGLATGNSGTNWNNAGGGTNITRTWP